MAGPQLVVALSKSIPAPTPGGPGRVVEPNQFHVGKQPADTEPGRVRTDNPGDRSQNAGEDGRVAGPQNRSMPDNSDNRHIRAGQDNPSEAKEHDYEDGRVVKSEQDYGHGQEEATMRRFGTEFNRTEDGMWADPTAATSNAMHFHYDPTEKEFHFTATAQDGSPMASIVKKEGTGRWYLMTKSMGGRDGKGLLGFPVGQQLSGAMIRNRLKNLWKESVAEPLNKAMGPDGKEKEADLEDQKKPMKKKAAKEPDVDDK